MARNAQDRENLLRDATAFVRRIEFHISLDNRPTVVFAGFRSTGAVSFYFDGDPVYHFNSQGELRRAFVDDQLIKAEQGRLIGWSPQRNGTEVEMLRAEVDTQKFCETMRKRLQSLQNVLRNGEQKIAGQAPAEGDLIGELKTWLAQHQETKIADSPRVS